MGVSCTIECRCPHGAVRGERGSRGGVLWRLGAACRRPVPVPMGDCRRPRRRAGCGRRVCVLQRMARVPVAVPPARGHRRCSGRGRVRLRGLRAGFSPLHERNRGRGAPQRLSISCAGGCARHARTHGCPGVFSRARSCARRARTHGCPGAFSRAHSGARHARTYGCLGALSRAHGCACHARTYGLTGVFSRGHAYSYTASVPHGYCHTASIPHSYSHTASAPHAYPNTDAVSHTHARAADWAHQGQGRRVPGPGQLPQGQRPGDHLSRDRWLPPAQAGELQRHQRAGPARAGLAASRPKEQG